MEKFSTYLNTATVTMKTLGGIVTIIVGISYMVFKSDTHQNNDNIHISPAEILTIRNKTQGLRDRIELLEWELRQQQERCTKRHNRQEKLLK